MGDDFLHNLVKFCHFFCCYVLLFFSCVYGARELASNHRDTLEMKSLLPISCSAPSKGLQIAHRYEPCSPLGQKNQRVTSSEVLLQDLSRVDSLNSISSRKLSTDDFDFGTKLRLSKKSNIIDGNFVTTVGFGTPKRDLTLMFDTGSFITWVQCQPSDGQGGPIFDPSKSSTFSNASCTTPTCNYSQDYHDGTFSKGFYAKDTLTVSSDVLPNFVFGCGEKKSDGFGGVAGILALGQGDNSFMSQTLKNYLQMFCYCLPSSESSTGYLVLGTKALITCLPEINIPLLTDQTGSNQYFVKFIGITIGPKRLDISANASSSSPPRAIIDSGTTISRLPPSVYSELRSSFRELMSKYSLVASTTDQLLDTCYNLEGYDLKNIIPSMTLHFENSNDLPLDYSAVVLQESVSRVCLAFAGNKNSSDLTIIGNNQQQNIKIYYDILGKKVGFSAGDCGN